MSEKTRYAICHSLSKSGSLNGFTDHDSDLIEFEKTGSTSAKVEFYIYLRDNSMRLEEEWRDEFKSYFPSVNDHLPEALELELVEDDDE